MGEGTPHVAEAPVASARVAALGTEATAARDRLEALVEEVRRRRDEVMDWRSQLRRHRRELTIALGAVVAIAAAGLAVQITRRRRHAGLATRVAELTDKAERLQRALGRVLEDPDSLAPAAPPKRKVKAMWATMSAALPLVRILLPHLVAALGRRRR